MLLECIGIVSLLLVLSRPTDSSPPHNTQLRSGVGGWSLFSLSLTELSSRTDLGSNLNVEDNVGVVVRNVVVTVVVTVQVVGLKGAAAWEV